jgi:hypothetical protein
MFNSLGNLAVDRSAALLFLDFATGRTVQLSGTAAIEWITPGSPGDDDDTGRRVRYTPRRVVTGGVALHAVDLTPYPRNPELGSPDRSHSSGAIRHGSRPIDTGGEPPCSHG